MSRPKGKTLTRKDVVAAAMRCLIAEGESGLGVNRVARELGIQPPSVYKHIDGNDALRRAVAAEAMALLSNYLQQQVQGIVDRQLLLRTIANSIRQFFHQYPTLHGVLTTTLIDETESDYQISKTAFFQCNAEMMRLYGLENHELVHAIRMFVAACHGFVLLERSRQFNYPTSLDDSYEWMVQTFIAALSQRQQ
jgi:AcrR family transcriptional regulator